MLLLSIKNKFEVILNFDLAVFLLEAERVRNYKQVIFNIYNLVLYIFLKLSSLCYDYFSHIDKTLILTSFYLQVFFRHTIFRYISLKIHVTDIAKTP